MVKLLDLLARSDWHTVVRDLPGYDPTHAGEVVSLRQALPWYAFRTPKTGVADHDVAAPPDR